MQLGGTQAGMVPIAQRSHSLTSVDTRGKHRLQAELKRLEQEARYLEEELEQLDKIEKASAACKELLSKVESSPDPLLPVYYHLPSYNRPSYSAMGSLV